MRTLLAVCLTITAVSGCAHKPSAPHDNSSQQTNPPDMGQPSCGGPHLRAPVEVYVDNGRDAEKGEVKRAHDSAAAAHTRLEIVDPQHRGMPIANSEAVKLTPIVPSSWPADCATNPNECSIGIRVDYCSSSILLMGDAEAGEEAMLDAGGPATLLQLGHHGSDTSSSDPFLKQVSPKYAVISAGKPGEGLNATYCHPRESTVTRIIQKLGGPSAARVDAFDAAAACRNAQSSNWHSVATNDRLWATERGGDVVVVTTGDGIFRRE
jgi:competence protein ComEC